jgi:hypothetical protein
LLSLNLIINNYKKQIDEDESDPGASERTGKLSIKTRVNFGRDPYVLRVFFFERILYTRILGPERCLITRADKLKLESKKGFPIERLPSLFINKMLFKVKTSSLSKGSLSKS